MIDYTYPRSNPRLEIVSDSAQRLEMGRITPGDTISEPKILKFRGGLKDLKWWGDTKDERTA